MPCLDAGRVPRESDGAFQALTPPKVLQLWALRLHGRLSVSCRTRSFGVRTPWFRFINLVTTGVGRLPSIALGRNKGKNRLSNQTNLFKPESCGGPCPAGSCFRNA